MSYASKRPPYISLLNDPHLPCEISLVCSKSQSLAMIFIVNFNDIVFNPLQIIWKHFTKSGNLRKQTFVSICIFLLTVGTLILVQQFLYCVDCNFSPFTGDIIT